MAGHQDFYVCFVSRLRGADFTGANLDGTLLDGANLGEANLDNYVGEVVVTKMANEAAGQTLQPTALLHQRSKLNSEIKVISCAF